MRIAALILGILGGIAAAILGAKWLGDAKDLESTIAAARALGADTGELDRTIYAAYALLAALALGVVGGVLTMKDKGKVGGLLMAIGVAVPAALAPKSLVFTCILALGALFAFLAKPRAGRATAAAAPVRNRSVDDAAI